MAFENLQFRDALGQFPTGVTVVTSQVDGVKIAITVSSFNAVSRCVPRSSCSASRRNVQSFDLGNAPKTFAVMVLQEGQDALSTKFAKARRKQVARYRCRSGSDRGAVLPTWLACFECKSTRGMTMAIMRSSGRPGCQFAIRNASVAGPLVILRGRYRALGWNDGYGTGPGDIWLHGW